MCAVENPQLNAAVSFEEAQYKYTQVAGELAAHTLRVAYKDHQNRGENKGIVGRPKVN